MTLALYPVLTIAQTVDQEAARADGKSQYRLFCAECHEGAILEAPGNVLLVYSLNGE